jgi:signal transduction histidine kinase
MEYRLRRFDGEYRWIFATGVPRFTSDGSFVGYTGSAIDVTEHKMARAALSNLSQKLMQAQEEERTRIARELHDDVCQQLATLRIQLDELVQRRPNEQTALVDALRELSRQALRVGADIQALSHRLHSSKLQLLGLSSAAASFCREFGDQQKVTIRFTSEAVPVQLPYEMKIALFRVMQEALMNAVKYSGVREFDVAVYRRGNSLHLEVTDHGVGFDPESALAKNGLGLVSMRERLGLIGGDLLVLSHPGQGTTIRASVHYVDPTPSPVSPITPALASASRDRSEAV